MIQVKWLPAINAYSLERALRAYYDSSLASGVEIDLSDVTWVEPFELSILTLWLREIAHRSKPIRVILPRATTVYGELNRAWFYLRQVRFIRFLHGIDAVQQEVTDINAKQNDGGDVESIAPLIFLNSIEDVIALTATSETRHQTELYFGSLTDEQWVKNGDIRSVLLREIGDNMFVHASGRFAQILMTFRPGTQNPDPDFARRRRAMVPEYEQDFFSNLGSRGYLTLVLADKGAGIVTTLRRTCNRERGESATGSTDADIIAFSFGAYTTRRKPKERLGHLLPLIQRESLNEAVPQTGLYWVLQAVKTYRGLIQVRSGRTTVTWDFLSHPQTGMPGGKLVTNLADHRLKKLIRFGGTQIKIYLPVGLPRPIEATTIVRKSLAQARRVEWMLVEEPTGRVLDTAALATWLDTTMAQLGRQFDNRMSPLTLALDLADWTSPSGMHAKTLFLLITYAMRLQNEQSNLVLHDPRGILQHYAVAVESILKQEALGIRKFKPALVLNEGWDFSILGLDYNDSMAALGNKPIRRELAERLPHLLDWAEGGYQLRMSLDGVRVGIERGIRRHLQRVLETPPVYNPGYYIFSSGVIANGFYEIRQIENRQCNMLFTALLLKRWLASTKPALVVSFGVSAVRLVEAIFSDLGIRHIGIPAPYTKQIDLLKLSLVARNTPTVLLTDVLGTARGLEKVLEFCSHLDVSAVLALVDARANNRTGADDVPRVFYILRCPLHFWFEGKPPGVKYSDIVAIDSATNVPIRHESQGDVVWRMREGSKNLLIGALGDSDSAIQGHFAGRRRHVLHYVLNDKLIDTYRDSMCDAVERAMSTFAETDHNVKKFPVSHIVYPDYTVGIEGLVQGLVRRFPGSKPVGVDWNELRPPVALPGFHDFAGTVIVLDDVLASGFTIWQMIDLAEVNKARATCAFVLLDRSDEWTSRLLRRNQEYGGTTLHMAFMAHLSIPTFLPIDCPACARQRRLEEARHTYGWCVPLREAIDREIDSNREREIRHLETPHVRNAALARDLNERLRSFEVRELLELSIRSGSIRTTLYDLVAQDSLYAHSFYEIIVQEESRIRAADFASVLNEQLRALVRKHFAEAIEACEIDPRRLETVAAAFRIIDPERFIDAVSASVLMKMPPSAVARVWLELSFTPQAHSYGHFIEATWNRWSSQLSAPWGSSLAQAWKRHFDETTPAAARFSAYRDILLVLDDSGECAQAIAELEWRRIDRFSFNELHSLLGKWELLAMIVREKVLRVARDLVFGEEPKTSETLYHRLSYVSDLLTNGSALVNALRVGPSAPDETLNAFKDLVDELYDVCIRDGEDTLPSIMRSYQVRLLSIVNKIMARWSDSIGEKEIEVNVDVDPEFVVFGPEHLVNGVVYVLIENVITRAFPLGFEGRRLATVCASAEGDHIIFRVTDTGVGANKYGPRGGLRTLAKMARDICDHRDVRRGEQGLGTIAEVSFFRIGEDMR